MYSELLYIPHQVSPNVDILHNHAAAAAAVKSLQSCLTLFDPIDSSPPGSTVSGILQARIPEWVAISLSKACKHAKSLQLFLTLCDPMDSSPPVSSVHRILQARILEWVAISFSIHNHSSVIKTKELILVELQTSLEFANFFTIILFLFPHTI